MNSPADVYESLQQEVIRFKDIQLLPYNWPSSLKPRTEKNGVEEEILRSILDAESYERTDKADLSEGETNAHKMLILRDASGVWLLNGMATYDHCQKLVLKNRLPQKWNMCTISTKGKLKKEERIALAFYVAIRRLRQEGNGGDEVSLSQFFKAIGVYIHSTGFPRSVGLKELFQKMKTLFRECNFENVTDIVVNATRTAIALKENSQFLNFLETYEESLAKKKETEDWFTFEWPEAVFMYTYHETWWSREALGVQLILVFLLTGFEEILLISILRRKRLLLQMLEILRVCEKVMSLVYPTNLETAILGSDKLEETLLYSIAKSLSGILTDTAWSLNVSYPRDSVESEVIGDGFVQTDVRLSIPLKAALSDEKFAYAKDLCISKTVEVLDAKRICAERILRFK